MLSSTVKNISVTYDAINEGNTFSSGDNISGRITLELAKDCKTDSLFIKAKGKAEVHWTEKHGQDTVVYHSKEKYFSIKQFILQEQKGQDCVIAPGRHVYPFTFRIPQQDMPSSFKGSFGKVLYTLEAKLSRSMKIDSKASAEFSVVSMPVMDSIPGIMSPQYGTKDKKMTFTSGTVAMDINTERMGFYQGEGLKVVATIQNNSSRDIKPKYSLYWKHSFFARGKRRVNTKEILKEEGQTIKPSARQTVTKVLNIPRDISTSILNCHILKAEYRLKVTLDVPYASDPELKFPVVILPAAQTPHKGQQPAAYSDFGVGSFGNPEQPPWNSVPAAPGFPTAPIFPPAPASGIYPPPPASGPYPPPPVSRPYPPPPAYGSMYPSF